MRHLIIATALATQGSALLADAPGMRDFSIDAPHHGRAVTGKIWYPATGDSETVIFAENPVFQGVTAAPDASVAPGQHPVVLLSHGFGGSMYSMAWLASGLAERGAIVVSVNHPNTTWRDFDLAKGTRHWTRAQDLSRAMDWLAADPTFAPLVDNSRIMAAGFSYGGWTALSLGGARGNQDGIVNHCSTHGDDTGYCDILLSDEADISKVDPEIWNASYRDARVTHVAAIDPGFVWGIEAEDTSDLVANLRLIGFGDLETRLSGTDFETSGFADLVPEAEAEYIISAVHFTGMPLCKPAGTQILEDENDDPVCTDPDGTDRAAVHAQVIDRLASDLGL